MLIAEGKGDIAGNGDVPAEGHQPGDIGSRRPVQALPRDAHQELEIALFGNGIGRIIDEFLERPMRIGARLIKPLLVIVCIAFAIKLLSDPANPLRVWLGV